VGEKKERKKGRGVQGSGLGGRGREKGGKGKRDIAKITLFLQERRGGKKKKGRGGGLKNGP